MRNHSDTLERRYNLLFDWLVANSDTVVIYVSRVIIPVGYLVLAYFKHFTRKK